MHLLTKIFMFWLLLAPHAGATELVHNSDCDRWWHVKGSPKGIIILTHGMNLLPQKMDELAQEFVQEGFDVFRPAFAGHCGKNNNYLAIKAEQWKFDAETIYREASLHAQQKSKPLYLVAYSFSALIYQTLDLPFSRAVYFAPPLALHYWFPFLALAAKFFPNITFQSPNLESYRANEQGGFSAIHALDIIFKQWNTEQKFLYPVLAWIDPQDELVSFTGLQKFQSENFQIKQTNNAGSVLKKTFHHLIISKEALGNVEWNRVKKETLLFLENKTQ